MRLIKALCLAAVAAAIAVALIGNSSSLAGAEDWIVLCKKLVEKTQLCPTGELWPEESVILALAKNVEFDGSLPIKCEDSLLEAVLIEEIGPGLPITIQSLVFGKLPTPKLGEGCTTCAQIHSLTPSAAAIETPAEEDKFFLNATIKLLLLDCTASNLECTYSTNQTKAFIDHGGTHAKHKGENLARIKIREQLQKLLPSSTGCPMTIEMLADYVITSVHWQRESGLGWPALDILLR
jgi:hypothetical protein